MQVIDEYTTYWKIIRRVHEDATVLDVGCGNGVLGDFLIKLKKCTMYGIEINKLSAQEANRKGYEFIYIFDLDSIDRVYVPFRSKSFDYIIFADVLEHLKDPLKVLITLKPLLKDSGHIICSIPNIAVWGMRLKLLLGKWEYEDYGILDKTHLRFFTIKTAKELVERAGFKIIDSDYTPYFLKISRRSLKTAKQHINRKGTTKLKAMVKKILNYIAKLRPNLFACQIVIDAVKIHD